jgi:deoxyadenosine/deoxycytidine kinase
MRIEIVGGIASGKSTLTSVIAKTGVLAIFEDFSTNPFFEKFYGQPKQYAFETEITFMLQHYSQLNDALTSSSRAVAADFSLALDIAYARVTLDLDDRRVFEAVFDRVLEKIQTPQLLVKLECSPFVELQRIRARARPAESAIEISYLAALNDAVNDVLLDRRFKDLKVLRIDSEKRDFRPGGDDEIDVVSEVLSGFLDSSGENGLARHG